MFACLVEPLVLAAIGLYVVVTDALERNAHYYWRIVAVNSAGQSTTWRTVNYRTPA